MGRINSSHQFRKSSFPRITFFLPQPHAACVCIANRRVIGIAGAPRIFTLIGLLCGKFFSISSLEANVCPASSPFDGSDTGRPCGCGDSRGHRVPRHGVRGQGCAKKKAKAESELYDCQKVFHSVSRVGRRTHNASRGDESTLKS